MIKELWLIFGEDNPEKIRKFRIETNDIANISDLKVIIKKVWKLDCHANELLLYLSDCCFKLTEDEKVPYTSQINPIKVIVPKKETCLLM
jgi:hypothetical protein